MKKLILLKGIGINGKSSLVTSLRSRYPNIIQLPQTNREYFKQNPSELIPGSKGITEFYLNRLDQFDFSQDGVYISERSPLDYLLNFEMRRYAKGELASDYMLDRGNLKDVCISYERDLIHKFDEVLVMCLATYDLVFLYLYLNEATSGLHKDYYHTRGHYISLQDRWLESWDRNNEVYKTESVVKNFYDHVPLNNLKQDLHQVYQTLIQFLEPNLFNHE